MTDLDNQISKRGRCLKSIDIIRVKGMEHIADGNSRVKNYGDNLTKHYHPNPIEDPSGRTEYDSLSESWEVWKDLISWNPRADDADKIFKIGKIADDAASVYGCTKENMSSKLGDLLGISDRAIREYLPNRYKAWTRKQLPSKKESLRELWAKMQADVEAKKAALIGPDGLQHGILIVPREYYILEKKIAAKDKKKRKELIAKRANEDKIIAGVKVNLEGDKADALLQYLGTNPKMTDALKGFLLAIFDEIKRLLPEETK